MVKATVRYIDNNTSPSSFFDIQDFFRNGTTIEQEDMNVWMPEFVADVQENTRELKRKAERLRRMAEKEKEKQEAIKKVLDFFRGFFGWF